MCPPPVLHLLIPATFGLRKRECSLALSPNLLRPSSSLAPLSYLRYRLRVTLPLVPPVQVVPSPLQRVLRRVPPLRVATQVATVLAPLPTSLFLPESLLRQLGMTSCSRLRVAPSLVSAWPSLSITWDSDLISTSVLVTEVDVPSLILLYLVSVWPRVPRLLARLPASAAYVQTVIFTEVTIEVVSMKGPAPRVTPKVSTVMVVVPAFPATVTNVMRISLTIVSNLSTEIRIVPMIQLYVQTLVTVIPAVAEYSFA